MRAFVIALLICAGVAAAAKAAEPADEAALRQIKTVLWPKAYFTQDTDLLGRILADEFQSVDGDGNWSTKVEELDWISKNKPSHDGFEFLVRRLEVFDNDTAVVAGTGTIRGKDEKGPYLIEYQSSNIFIKRDGRWQAIASHVSGAKKVAGSGR
jgi:hypothetical protein